MDSIVATWDSYRVETSGGVAVEKPPCLPEQSSVGLRHCTTGMVGPYWGTGSEGETYINAQAMKVRRSPVSGSAGGSRSR
jgi:hypothetical protein